MLFTEQKALGRRLRAFDVQQDITAISQVKSLATSQDSEADPLEASLMSMYRREDPAWPRTPLEGHAAVLLT